MTDDTISRRAAIDALLHNQEVYSNNFGTDPIDKYTTAIIANDVQTIAQLPSAEPRWIPVSERMPEQSNTVLITVKSRDYSKKESWLYFTDMAIYYGSNGIDWEMFNDWDEGQEYYITAWMPLPEPWKGADDDQC